MPTTPAAPKPSHQNPVPHAHTPSRARHPAQRHHHHPQTTHPPRTRRRPRNHPLPPTTRRKTSPFHLYNPPHPKQRRTHHPRAKKKPRSSFIRFEAALPNECWQADITYLYLADSTRIEVLDFLDDHSRYLLSITAAAAFTGTQVAEELTRLITEYGPPASTLTANGLVFTAYLAGRKGGRNAFEKSPQRQQNPTE